MATSNSTTSLTSARTPASPFDPYRDPFDTTDSRRDEHQGSWRSGGNNVNSASGQQNEMDIQPLGDGASGKVSEAHEMKKRRFVCPHCARTFARSGHLQRHERSRISLTPKGS